MPFDNTQHQRSCRLTVVTVQGYLKKCSLWKKLEIKTEGNRITLGFETVRGNGGPIQEMYGGRLADTNIVRVYFQKKRSTCLCVNS